MANKDNVLKLKAIMEHYHLSQTEMSKKTGIPQTNISEMIRGIRGCGDVNIAKIGKAFPEINPLWLISLSDIMFTDPTPAVMQNNVNGNNNYISGDNNTHIGYKQHNTSDNTPMRYEDYDHETSIEAQELQGAPVIPTALCREGGCDILEYIEENPEEVEISPIRAKGVTIDLWYRIRATDNSNAPTYMPGDNIALASYPKGEERPRPGRFYVVDTYSNGFELGILFPTDSGDFRMQKKNRDEFPEFTIERDDIIRIYRVIMMVRI